MVGSYRRHQGPHFSEGSRLLWLALPKLAKRWKVSEDSIREELSRRLGAARGTVNRYLFGDRRPDRGPAIKLKELAGIPEGSWDETPTEPFVIPFVASHAKGRGPSTIADVVARANGGAR